MPRLLVRRRVVSSFLAVHAGADNKSFITIPVDSTIETAEDTRILGLVEIHIDDHVLLAFMQDIEERTEPVASACSVGM